MESKEPTKNIVYGFEADELYAYLLINDKVVHKFNVDKLAWQHSYDNRWF